MATVIPTGSTGSSSTTYDPLLYGTLTDVLNAARTEANVPYEAYQGQRIANFTPEELQAFQQTRDLQGINQPMYDQSNALMQQGINNLGNLANFNSFTPSLASEYMNPYIQQVVQNTTNEALRSNQIQQNQLRNQAGNVGAFGGSRMAIAEQELANNTQRNLNNTVSDLYSQGYDKALSQFNADRQYGLDSLTPYLQYSNQLAGLADQNQAYRLKDTEALNNVGNARRNMAQTALDTAYQDWAAQKDYNKGQINYLSSVLQGANLNNYATGQSTNTQTIYPKASTFNSILGGLSTGLGFLSNAGFFGNKSSGGSNTLASILGFAEGGLVKGYAGGGGVQSYSLSQLTNLINRNKAIANDVNSSTSDLIGANRTLEELNQEFARRQGMFDMSPIEAQPEMASAPDNVVNGFAGQYSPEDRSRLDSMTNVGFGISGSPTPLNEKTQAAVQGENRDLTLSDLFTYKDSPMDKLMEPNALIMAGLGLLGASGNPNDAGFQIANGLGSALETYEEMKNKRAGRDTERGTAMSNAINSRLENEIRRRTLEETARNNRATEDYNKQRIAVAMQAAAAKNSSTGRVKPTELASLQNAYTNLVKQAESTLDPVAKAGLINQIKQLEPALQNLQNRVNLFGLDAEATASDDISKLEF